MSDEVKADSLTRFRVWLRSVPGFYEQYDGKVDVVAENADDAGRRAKAELRRTTFKDRNDSMWRIEKVEQL